MEFDRRCWCGRHCFSCCCCCSFWWCCCLRCFAHSLAVSYARLWAEFLFSDCINFVKFGIGVLSSFSLSVCVLRLVRCVARVHACSNSVTARLYTADCKMRLTNPFVYFEFCGWLTDWRLWLLLLPRPLLLLLVQHRRCTTFIRRTDLFYMCLHRPFLFHFFFHPFDGFAHLLARECCGCCVPFVHSFIHSISFHFTSTSSSSSILFHSAISLLLLLLFCSVCSFSISLFLQRYSVSFIQP